MGQKIFWKVDLAAQTMDFRGEINHFDDEKSGMSLLLSFRVKIRKKMTPPTKRKLLQSGQIEIEPELKSK